MQRPTVGTSSLMQTDTKYTVHETYGHHVPLASISNGFEDQLLLFYTPSSTHELSLGVLSNQIQKLLTLKQTLLKMF